MSENPRNGEDALFARRIECIFFKLVCRLVKIAVIVEIGGVAVVANQSCFFIDLQHTDISVAARTHGCIGSTDGLIVRDHLQNGTVGETVSIIVKRNRNTVAVVAVAAENGLEIAAGDNKLLVQRFALFG